MEQLALFDDLDPSAALPVRGRRVERMRNITVTARNIIEVPIDWLCIRSHKLSRWIRESNMPKEEWIQELELIHDHLKKREQLHHSTHVFEQLELDGIPHPGKESYVGIVEERLREHYRQRQERAWLEQRIKSGIDYETSVTAVYGNLAPGRSAEQKSIVENHVIRSLNRNEQLEKDLMELEEELMPLQRIIDHKLTFDQKQLVESKYFARSVPKDDELILKFHVGRQKYYTIKKQAISRIAYELGIL
ncbi:hypothetical protein [Paenibacillus pinisoli]|nr:hypothetical protein [Paenibacillus pinisoli]